MAVANAFIIFVSRKGAKVKIKFLILGVLGGFARENLSSLGESSGNVACLFKRRLPV
jgi:hypothetical protein